MGVFTAGTLGSLTLSDVCEDARLENPGGVGFSMAGDQIPGRPGVVHDPESSRLPLELQLRTILKAGLVVEGLQKIHRELAGRSLVPLTTTLSFTGEIRAMCRLVGGVNPGGDPSILVWPLSVPSGSWQDASESSEGPSTSPAVVTGGAVEIHDPIVVFSGPGTYTHTAADGTVTTITAAAGPTYPVTVEVDAGNGHGRITDNAGADAADAVTFNQAYWLRFAPNAAQSISSTVNCTTKWRNRWA